MQAADGRPEEPLAASVEEPRAASRAETPANEASADVERDDPGHDAAAAGPTAVPALDENPKVNTRPADGDVQQTVDDAPKEAADEEPREDGNSAAALPAAEATASVDATEEGEAKRSETPVHVEATPAADAKVHAADGGKQESPLTPDALDAAPVRASAPADVAQEAKVVSDVTREPEESPPQAAAQQPIREMHRRGLNANVARARLRATTCGVERDAAARQQRQHDDHERERVEERDSYRPHAFWSARQPEASPSTDDIVTAPKHELAEAAPPTKDEKAVPVPADDSDADPPPLSTDAADLLTALVVAAALPIPGIVHRSVPLGAIGAVLVTLGVVYYTVIVKHLSCAEGTRALIDAAARVAGNRAGIVVAASVTAVCVGVAGLLADIATTRLSSAVTSVEGAETVGSSHPLLVALLFGLVFVPLSRATPAQRATLCTVGAGMLFFEVLVIRVLWSGRTPSTFLTGLCVGLSAIAGASVALAVATTAATAMASAMMPHVQQQKIRRTTIVAAFTVAILAPVAASLVVALTTLLGCALLVACPAVLELCDPAYDGKSRLRVLYIALHANAVSISIASALCAAYAACSADAFNFAKGLTLYISPAAAVAVAARVVAPSL